uniref:(California timema) hypothetical protein n=1 Tax=Timema californicum TaxID=61474 RepID=A0A7R9J3C0_TIMCA|nr:unnamed protein product [Timema californicum]
MENGWARLDCICSCCLSASACLQYMITGSSLIKVRPNSRQYHRFFTLSEDMNTLKWTPTNKKTAKAVRT